MCPLHLSAAQLDEVSAEFLALFPLPAAGDPRVPLQAKRLAYLARKGRAPPLLGRSLLWRVLLGLLPCDNDDTSSWEETTLKHRAMYQALKARVFPDIAASASDPLNGGGGSTWELYYRNIELMNEIKTDLQRLYPNDCDDYFMQPKRQEALANVLLVWARQHEHVAYRQGMHELLAPLLLVVEADCRNLRAVADRHPHVLSQHGVISLILDEAQLEADCYWMFDVVMREVSSVFVARPDAHLSDPCRPDVRELCDRIQQELLHKVDPQLANHLQREGVSSHLYGIKWVRLMFAREFSLQDMLVLWDFLFAGFFEGHSLLEMVEVVSVAMIHLLRDQLLQSDVHECLSQLMRYPGVSKIEELLTLSAVIQSDPDSLSRSPGKETNGPPASAAASPATNKPSWLLSSHRRQSSHAGESAASHHTNTTTNTNSNATAAGARPEQSGGAFEEGAKSILTRMVDAATRLRSLTTGSNSGSADALQSHNEGIAVRLERVAEQLRNHNLSNDDTIHEVVTRLTTLASSLVNSRPLTEYDEAFGDPPVQLKSAHLATTANSGTALTSMKSDQPRAEGAESSHSGDGNSSDGDDQQRRSAVGAEAEEKSKLRHVDPLAGFVLR